MGQLDLRRDRFDPDVGAVGIAADKPRHPDMATTDEQGQRQTALWTSLRPLA
jgi:hypothetical protein